MTWSGLQNDDKIEIVYIYRPNKPLPQKCPQYSEILNNRVALFSLH